MMCILYVGYAYSGIRDPGGENCLVIGFFMVNMMMAVMSMDGDNNIRCNGFNR